VWVRRGALIVTYPASEVATGLGDEREPPPGTRERAFRSTRGLALRAWNVVLLWRAFRSTHARRGD